MIKYSVIVCSYNGANYISECLQSLVNQSVPNDSYEIIVVNDGSTDNLEEKVAVFLQKYKNIKFISYKPNKGLSFARNIGWKNASGDFIFYIDDDAVADPDWLERLSAYYTDSNIAGVGGYARAYFSNNIYTEYELAKCYLEYGKNAENLNKNNLGAGGLNMSFRKKVLEEVDGFDPIFKAVGDDADINFRIRQKGYKLVTVASITVRHRTPTNFRSFIQKKVGRGAGEYIFSYKYRQKHNFFRSLIGLFLALVNIPGSLINGVKMARLINKPRLFFSLSCLFFCDKIFTKFGKLKSALNNGKSFIN